MLGRLLDAKLVKCPAIGIGQQRFDTRDRYDRDVLQLNERVTHFGLRFAARPGAGLYQRTRFVDLALGFAVLDNGDDHPVTRVLDARAARIGRMPLSPKAVP
jgi:hypothetical protein